MAEGPLLEALIGFNRRNKRPLSVGVINTGGTFTAVPKEVDGELLLEPANSEDQLIDLFFNILGLEFYVEQGLLNLMFTHLFAMDSSQAKDYNRQTMVNAIVSMYRDVDGMVAIHGTDTGTKTAQFFAMSLPYHDPREIWKSGIRKENWTKPVLLISSQEPALHIYDDKTIRRLGSDADRNLRTGLTAIAEGNIGEAGLLTNDLTVLRATASTKRHEIDIPPYETDPSVRPIAEYTATGLRYPGSVLRPSLRTAEQLGNPFVIDQVAKYEGKVLVVYDSQHLDLCRLYLENIDKGVESVETLLKAILPDSIVYVSVGAGNVDGEDYEVLAGMMAEDIPVFRVPIPGGRIPVQQIYNVPGHDIPPVNMLPDAARYKVQATLALGDLLGIKKSERKVFAETMVTTDWGLEILPQL